MTFKEWLSKHNFAVRIERRGFNIENGLGEGRYIVLIEGRRITRFVDYADAYAWVKKNLKDPMIDEAARKDFKHVVVA